MKRFFNSLIFVTGVFLLALVYNLFFLPHNLVIGGTTGLGIIFKNKINPTLFIYAASVVLIGISYLTLGRQATAKTLVGSILYPLFISLSKPIAIELVPYFKFDEYLIIIILAAIFYGVSHGLIFRTGYTTGGFDIVASIITKYLKIPQAKALFLANSIVIAFGGLVFGFESVVYALIILFIGSSITNKIVIGISESKMFFIYTRKTKQVKDLIITKLKTGYTVLPTVGGYSHTKREMIMCVLPTKDYYLLKELVLGVDAQAFIAINDCYDVNGGFQKALFPFS